MVDIPNHSLYLANNLPMAVKGGTGIRAELYSVPKWILESIDYLEGHPYFYKRNIVEDSKGVKGYLYTVPPEYVETGIHIESGDFINFLDDLLWQERRNELYEDLSTSGSKELEIDLKDDEYSYLDEEFTEYEDFDSTPTLVWDRKEDKFWCEGTYFGKLNVKVKSTLPSGKGTKTKTYFITREKTTMKELAKTLKEVKSEAT